MIYIFAGNPMAAQGVAMRMGLQRDTWRMIVNSSDLRGVRNICVLRVSGWYTHPHSHEIETMLHEINAWIWEEKTR